VTHCITAAENSGLCASSALEGLSCLPYSEKERNRPCIEAGSSERKSTCVPSNSHCSAHRCWLSFPYVLNSPHFTLRLSDLTAQTAHREHLTKSGKVSSDTNSGTLALLLTNLF